MMPLAKRSPIRPFAEEDIPQVAELHRIVFGTADQPSPELTQAYRAYFTEVYLHNPWSGSGLDSLVHEREDGKIDGFLGVAPRPMSMGGRRLQAAITTNFIVDPQARGLAGIMLQKAVFAGPQDLTIADESNATSRGIWEGLGGTTSLLYSMHWYYPLQPCQFALIVAKKKKLLPSFIRVMAHPAARAVDALAGRILLRSSRPPEKQFVEEELNCETLAACLSHELTKPEAGKPFLRMDYDDQSLSWMLERADRMPRNGHLQKVIVKNEKQEIAGWYLYYVNSGGISEVIQFHAKPRFATDVLNHLFHRAWRQGVTVLSGRLEPRLMQIFSDTHCIFHCGPQWVLVHSRRPEIIDAFHRGDANFSRLDGEWCCHFR